MSRLLHWLHTELIEAEDARTQLQGESKGAYEGRPLKRINFRNTEILKKGHN